MPNPPLQMFGAAEETLLWARQALLEIRQFAAQAAEGLTIEHTPIVETGETITYLCAPESPSKVRRLANEALLNTRHSFDQSLYAAQHFLHPREKWDRNFPWGEDERDFESRFRIFGIDPRLHEALSARHPWPNESHAHVDTVVRDLSKLANNKHSVGLTIEPGISGVRYPAFEVPEGSSVDLQGNFRANDDGSRRWEIYRSKGTFKMTAPFQFSVDFFLHDERCRYSHHLTSSLERFIARAEETRKALELACMATLR